MLNVQVIAAVREDALRALPCQGLSYVASKEAGSSKYCGYYSTDLHGVDTVQQAEPSADNSWSWVYDLESRETRSEAEGLQTNVHQGLF